MVLFRKFFGKYSGLFLLAMTCLTLEAIFDLMMPTLMSKIVDIGVMEKDMDYIIKIGSFMLLLTGMGAISAIVRSIIASTLSQKVGTNLRLELFQKIHSLPFKDIDQFDTGSLITRLTNDVTQVQHFVMGIMRIFVKAPLLCIGSIVMAVILSPSMSLIIILIVPVISFLLYLNIKAGYPLFMKVQQALDKVNGVMREYLAGVRVVKAFNRFDYEVERFSKNNEELAQTSINSMRVMSIFLPIITLVVNLGIVAVLIIGGFKINQGSMQVGKVIALINYMIQILTSMVAISNIITILVRTKASSERIEEVLKTNNVEVFAKELLDISDVKGRLDFENVSFSYSDDAQELILKGISFTCLEGQTIGIIGSTGSGKSTLVNLIPRFYDCNSGNIRLDGVDIKKIAPKQLREHIAIVPQKSTLFTGTIKENILWGKPDATNDEIKAAVAIAQANFIDNFTEGYETILGQGGVNLSGGQKQRLSIARAIIKKPNILILDDCTSAVDVATEFKIRKGIKTFAGNLTCIIIAQRITSVMTADLIVVLEKGQIVGEGTHESLLSNCDVYKDIYKSQMGREAI